MVKIKNKGPLIVASLFAILSINACSGTSPSRPDTQCQQPTAGGEFLLTDNSSTCVKVLNKKDAPVCGKRIRADDVLVIDMESPQQKSQLEQAGPYKLIDERPVAIPGRGSKVQTVLSATNKAAALGCNLLLTGSTQTVEVRNSDYRNSVTIDRYLLVYLAVRER